MLRLLVSAAAVTLATSVAIAEPTTRPGPGEVVRVAGDVPEPTPIEVDGDDGPETHWASGDALVRTALPVGYPRPTPPGAVELKAYAPVRQAIVAGEGAEQRAFFPLFRHISTRDIAMTAPVVMTGSTVGGDEVEGSMAFLYRSPDLGPVGDAEEGVVVEDTEPGFFLSAGFQGSRRQGALEEARVQLVETFEATLAQQGWRLVDGPVRLLGYNGPAMPRDRQWWEVQVPVEPIDAQ
ncbi:MAG: hypothetical protein AAGI46_06400 [Planctomycetota bacterium]